MQMFENVLDVGHRTIKLSNKANHTSVRYFFHRRSFRSKSHNILGKISFKIYRAVGRGLCHLGGG